MRARCGRGTGAPACGGGVVATDARAARPGPRSTRWRRLRSRGEAGRTLLLHGKLRWSAQQPCGPGAGGPRSRGAGPAVGAGRSSAGRAVPVGTVGRATGRRPPTLTATRRVGGVGRGSSAPPPYPAAMIASNSSLSFSRSATPSDTTSTRSRSSGANATVAVAVGSGAIVVVDMVNTGARIVIWAQWSSTTDAVRRRSLGLVLLARVDRDLAWLGLLRDRDAQGQHPGLVVGAMRSGSRVSPRNSCRENTPSGRSATCISTCSASPRVAARPAR